MKPRAQQGVSLIEAMVALAVMAFGMLGLAGLQSSMRLNADIAKQRSEAVRIAQEQMEAWRRFSTLDQFRDNVVTIVEADAAGLNNTNTTYRIAATVDPAPTNPPTTPPLKSASIRVSWTDRSNTVQEVVLTSRIAAVDRALGAALGVPSNGAPTARARTFGRNPGIPPQAVPQSDGTSRFVPPGGGSVGWVFSNTTGLIIQLCNATFTQCTSSNLLLLTGFIRYGQWTSQPTPQQAENPVVPFLGGFPETIGLRVAVTSESPAQTIDCAMDQGVAYTVYYCALPLTLLTDPPSWSGSVELRGFNVASDPEDNNPSKYRVCRYTTERTNTPAGGNLAHPLVYSDVGGPLRDQNYLIIRAGAGGDTPAFTCPADDPSTPFVNGNTYDHQPPRS